MLKNKYISVIRRLSLFYSLMLIFLLIFSSNAFSQATNVTAAALTTSGDPYPSDGMCPTSNLTIQVKVVNNGTSAISLAAKPVTVSVTITGPVPQTFSTTINSGTIAVGASRYVNVTTIGDFSITGDYTVAMSATCTGDASPGTDATEVVSVDGNYITLTSLVATSAQTVCLNSPITTITYDVSSNATDASASGLPAGLSASFDYPTLTITGSPTTNVGSPFSYSVTATGACPSSEDSTLTGSLTVVSLPIVSVTGSSAICIGLTTNLSPTSGGTWASSDNTIATVTNGGLVTGIAAGTANFTFTNTATGCSDSLTSRIVVSAPPTTGVLSGNQAICIGGTSTFASTVAGGSWTSVSPATATVVAGTGVITGVAAGTTNITYTVTGSGGCADVSANRSVTVTAPPDPGTLSGTTAICNPGTTTLSSTNGGGTWSSDSPAIATIVAGTGVVNAVTSGSAVMRYTVTGTGGCADVDSTKTVVVTDPPVPGTLSGTQGICIAGTSTFTSSVAGGSWVSTTPAIASIIAGTGVITGVSGGTTTMTYTVTGTGGCSDVSDTRTVTVTAPPDPGVLSGTNAICNPGTSTFTSTIPGGAWSSGTPAVATIDATGNITSVSAGTSTISYTVTGTGGCTDVPGTRVLTVTAPPDAGTLSGTQAICIAGTTTYISSSPGGTWSSADGSIATVDAITGVVTGVSAGTINIIYTVTGTGGCSDAVATRSVTVTAPPDPGVLSGVNAICNASTTTFVSTIAGGTWSSATPAVATIDANTGVITALSVGSSVMSYTVSGTGGCSDVSDTRTVTVSAAPSAGSLSGTQAICANGSTVFTPTIAGGSWSTSDPLIATVSGGTVSGVGAGTATITYTITGTGGCSDVTTTRTVTVTAVPTAGVLSGTQAVCVSGTSTFSSTVIGGSWTSNDNTIASITSGGSISAIASGTATMTYTITGTGGCSDVSDTRTVTVSNAPSAGVLSGSQIICAGGSTTFASTVAGGSWTSGSIGIAIVDATSGEITGVSAGTATITYTITGTGGCADVTNTRTVTVKANPVVAAIIGVSSLCVGDNNTLTDATNGGSWSSSDGSIISIDNFGSITGLTSGNATITYSVTSNGCSTNVTKSIDVFDLPVVNAISGTTTFCVSTSTTLSNSTLGGTWSSDDITKATVSPTGVVTGVAAGSTNINYSVTINGCTTVQSVAVTVVGLPNVAAIAGANTVCTGQTSQLSDITGGGTWSSADPTKATISSSGLVTGIASGSTLITYSVTSGGCTNSRTLNVTVNASPVVSSSTGSSSLCLNNTTQLSNSTVGGVWSSDDSGIASVDMLGLVTGVSAGTTNVLYSVTSGGCTASDTFSITVNDFPVVPAIGGTAFVCVSATTQLSNAVAGGTWTSSSPAKATVNVAGLVTGVSAGSSTISYAVTTNGCTTTKTLDITVNTNASLSAIGGTMSICQGTTTTLTNSTVGGTWSSGSIGVATIDANTGVVTGVSPGSSIITYAISSGGCNASVTATVTVLSVPTVAAITGTDNVCTGNNITLSNVTAGGTWSTSDNTIATINSSGVLTGVSAGVVNALYSKTSGGCTTTSSYSIIVNATPTIAAISGTTSICMGNSTTLSSATVGGTWSSGTPGVATINISGVVSSVSAGTSVITYSLSIGSCSNAVNTTVTINALPIVANISGSSTLCVGDNTTLTNATNSGTWSSGTPVVASISGAGVLTGLSAGTTTVSYSVTSSGCTTTKTFDVSVSSYPVVANIAGTANVCVGSTVTLTNATAGGAWSSQNSAVASTNAFGLVTGVSAGTTNIDYTVTNGSCATTKSFAITVNSALSVSPIIGTTDICIGANSQLTDVTIGGTWSSSNTGVATVNSSGLVTSVSVGTTTIRYDVITNGVCPQFASVTFTVNQIPTVNAITDVTACQGSTVNAINFTGTGSPIYHWTNTNTSIGLAAIGTGDISSFTASGTSIGGASEIAVIDVTPIANGCSGSSKQFLITVNSLDNAGFNYSSSSFCHLDANPSPSITGLTGGTFTSSSVNLLVNSTTGVVDLAGSTPGYYQITYQTAGTCPNDSTIDFAISTAPTLTAIIDQTVCDGSDFNAINFIGSPGTIFNWTNDNTNIGLAASGTGNIGAFTATGTSVGGSSIFGKVIVTPTSGSCIGVKDTFLLTVNAKENPAFTYPSNSFCSTLDPNPIANITGKQGGIFTILPAGATLNANTGLINLASTSAGTYTLTYTTNGTCSNSQNLTLTIGSNPSVNVISNQSICSGSSFNAVNFSGTPGTTFNWTSSNPALIGIAPSGTGNISAFVASGASIGSPTVTSTITVTPTIGSCTGASKTFTLSVRYKDDVAISYSDVSYCSSNSNPSPSITGTSGGVFTSTPVGLIVNSSTGQINIGASSEGLYSVTYITNGTCGDTSATSVAINNSPSVNNIPDQTVCSGNNFSSVNFTGTVGTVYQWTNTNTAIGLVNSGTGDISSFTTLNPGITQLNSTITVTPKSGACTGASKTFNFKVNPSEDASFSYSSALVCQSNPNLTPIISGTSGGAFSSSVGLSLNPSSGVVNVASSSPGTYNIVYRTAGTCFDVKSTMLTINPTPSVNSIANVSKCQSDYFDPISFTGTVGASFDWTNSNNLIGLSTSGIGNIASFQALGTVLGGNPTSAVITVTPSINGCYGTSKSFILTTNSVDNPSFSYSNLSYCLSEANPSASITGKLGGSFSVSPVGLTVDSSTGTIDLSSASPGAYNITYTTNGFCPNDSTVLISVGSNPTIQAVQNQTVCQGSDFNAINFSGSLGSTFEWTNSNSAIGLASNGSGTISTFEAQGTTPGGASISSTIVVTPKVGTCVGTPINFSLTVKSLDDAAFSYSNSSFCKNQTNPTPTITGLSGGTFTSSPIGLAMNSVGTINLSTSTSGDYVVSYTTHGQCPNIGSFPISIGSNPTVNPVSDQSVCAGANFAKIDFSGNPGTVFNWTNTNTSIGLSASGSGDISSFTAQSSGSSIVVVTPLIGTCAGTSSTFTLTVNSIQSSSIQYGQSSYCTTDSDPTPIQTGPSSGVFSSSPLGLSIDPSSGTINLASSTAGNYTVNYTLSALCSTSSSTQISIGSGPTVNNVVSQVICNGSTFNAINFSGTPGTQFSWTNNNLSVGISASGNGSISSFSGVNNTNADIVSTITVIPTIGSCIGTSKSFNLTIRPSDNPTFNYSTSNICFNASDLTPTISGNSGGVFSSLPLGLNMNSSTGKINVGGSQPGNYNITYVTTGNCPKALTQSVIINPLPTVNNITVAPKCEGSVFNSISLSGSSNTIFNWTNSNTSIGLGASGLGIIPSFTATGTVKNGPNVSGIVVVTPEINGCLGNTMSFPITVNSLDDASFNFSKNSICQSDVNPTPVILGTSGGVFSSSPNGLSINPSTGRISIGSSTIGTYSVTYTTAGACIDDSTISITINPLPTVNGVAAQQRCFGDSFNAVNFIGSNNTTFDWTNSNSAIGLASSGSGNIAAFVAKGTVFGGNSISGNVVVTPVINGCSGTTTTFVLTVNPIDNPAFHYSDNSFCTSQLDPTPIVDGTLNGIFTSSPVGLVLNSSTGTINLNASTAGLYSVKYTTPGNCKDDSIVVIGVGSNPSVDDVDDQSYCQGDMFDPVIFTGNPGTIFNWTNTNNSIGLASSGVGNIAAFKAQGTSDGGVDASGTITITPKIGTCVGSIVNYKYKVRANPKIVASIANTTKQDTSFCKGGVAILSAVGASKNENYSWTPHTSLAGNIGIGSSVTTKTDTTQQYIVRGQSQFGCFNYDTLIVSVYNPTVNSKSDTTVCAGSLINSIQFKSNLPGTTFDWSNSNGNIGLGFNGTAIINSFTAKNNTITSKQTGTITVTPKFVIPLVNRTCIGPVMKFNISVNKQDDPSFTGYLAQYCANETSNTLPTISGVKGGLFTSNPSGLALNSNTGEIFPISSRAGSYSVKYTTNGTCPKSDSTYLFINPLIKATISGADTVCVNAISPQIKFKGENGVAPYIFKYKVNGGPIQTISTLPGKDDVTLSVSTNKSGIFTYELVNVEESSSSRCSNSNVFGVQSIIINELPTAQITSTATSICQGATSPEIRITGINGVSPFTFTYFISKDGNPIGSAQNAITNQGEYLAKIPVSTSSSGVYNYTVNIVKNGDDLSCFNNINISQVVTVKPLPTASITSNPSAVCMNGDAIIDFNASNGIPPFTFVYSINNGGSQTIKTANNAYSEKLKANTSSAGVYTYRIISVSDADATSCQNNSLSASAILNITPGTTVNKIQDINVCVNELSDTVELFGGVNGTVYNWYSNNTTIGINGVGQGNIMPFVAKNTSGSTTNISRITVIPSIGQCKGDTMKFDIVVRPKPKAKINAPNTVCPGDSIRLEGVGSELKYVWTPNVSCITCNPVIAKPTENTTYKAFVTDKYNCFDSTEFEVVVYRKPEINIDEPIVCGEPELVTLKGKGNNTYTYSDGIQDGVPFMPNKGKTSYIVTVKDNLGCKNTDTVNVYVVDKPVSKFTASPETGLASDLKPLNVLLTNKSLNSSEFEWFFRNGDESPVIKTTLEPVTALYKKPGIYVVTLISKNGKCLDSSSISIKIEKLDTPRVEIAPNVFTPDNDGTNDLFFITVKNAKNIHVILFNRWGNPIHEISETTQSWDGKINGQDADEGIYFYQYEIEGSSGEIISGKGFVQLIRK